MQLPAVFRWCVLLAFAALLASCGGGGGGGDGGAGGIAFEGSRETRTITSAFTATSYPLSIYLPPASAGPRAALPVLYALDGESWFETLVSLAEATRTRVIIVGVGTAGMRNRDFVPSNACTGGGGGNVAYFDFIRQELLPYVQGAFGGDPARRSLFGHSHGGAFVLYAMFAQSPGQHTFRSYLASEASISCMSGTADGWEQAYAAAHGTLPVRLHLSYATGGNAAANTTYGATISARNYAGLVMVSQSYAGSHNGVVPQLLAEAVPFALR